MPIVCRKVLVPVILSLTALIAVYFVIGLYGRKKESADKVSFTKTDPESITRGNDLFNSKCRFCHYTDSSEALGGPGLIGILKKERLPFSKRPSTPENIVRQIKKPVDRMPAFEYLSEKEISDILAYLYTL